MAVIYSIKDGLLTLVLDGAYPALDVPERFLEALADPACPRPVALLVDVSRSESLATRSVAEIRMISEFLGPYAERIRGRCAVLAPADVQFGLCQMGSVYCENVGVTAAVFRTSEEALAWLNATSAPRP